MNSKLNKNQIERFSRQIILKNIGPLGQKKIIQSKVLIIGMGGLGCPVAEFLTRAGIGFLGIDGGSAKKLCNLPILVKSKITARIQESHIFLGHHILEQVENKLIKNKKI